MSYNPADRPVTSLIDCPETKIAYLERRLDETTVQVADAGGICSYASHTGRAELYRLELTELRAGPKPALRAIPLLDEARDAAVIERSSERLPRPKLSLAGRRNNQGQPRTVLP